MTLTETQTIRQNILTLLDELPPDRLPMVETFMRFMQAQAAPTPQPTPWVYPTVTLPASSLASWIGLLDETEGYEGDALADTEALYDEV
jgi:hypothetical protein